MVGLDRFGCWEDVCPDCQRQMQGEVVALQQLLVDLGERLRLEGVVVAEASKRFRNARSALGTHPGTCSTIACDGCQADMEAASEYLDEGLSILKELTHGVST